MIIGKYNEWYDGKYMDDKNNDKHQNNDGKYMDNENNDKHQNNDSITFSPQLRKMTSSSSLYKIIVHNTYKYGKKMSIRFPSHKL